MNVCLPSLWGHWRCSITEHPSASEGAVLRPFFLKGNVDARLLLKVVRESQTEPGGLGFSKVCAFYEWLLG